MQPQGMKDSFNDVAGVVFPFRDLRQLMRNITYFASITKSVNGMKNAYSIT